VAEEILKSKRVNFLVADARVKRINPSVLLNAGTLAGVLETFRKAYGGLWVGSRSLPSLWFA